MSHWLNWLRTPFKTPVKLKIVQVPKPKTSLGCSASSRPADRPGINSASHWSALSTPAPPYMQPSRLQIKHSMISSRTEQTCPSSIPISTSTSPATKLTTSRVKATISTALLVVIDFNDGNEEDCNRIDDPGVEAIKVFEV